MAIRKKAEKTSAGKAPSRRTALSRRRAPKVAHAQIAECAYFLSIERGGSDLENWLLAERELVGA
jgi:hypothetical protein